eukprot:4178186-Amphidinium_carterae.1
MCMIQVDAYGKVEQDHALGTAVMGTAVLGDNVDLLRRGLAIHGTLVVVARVSTIGRTNMMFHSATTMTALAEAHSPL